MRRNGFTLLEIVVCIVLVSICTILVVALFPEGIVSIKKAENIEMARVYATEVAETMATGQTVASPLTPTLNSTTFTVVSQSTAVSTGSPLGTPSRLMQGIVTITWDRQPVPLVIGTRWYTGNIVP